MPAAKRKLVTTHDALGYFADRYGIEVIGAVIPSLSTQAQPSAKDVDELVDQIRSEGVEAIFPEAALSQKLEQAISREAGAEVGGELWADTLGPEGSSGSHLHRRDPLERCARSPTACRAARVTCALQPLTAGSGFGGGARVVAAVEVVAALDADRRQDPVEPARQPPRGVVPSAS